MRELQNHNFDEIKALQGFPAQSQSGSEGKCANVARHGAGVDGRSIVHPP